MLTEFFSYLTQKIHLEGFRLSHRGTLAGEGRKPGVFMNPQVIPTCIAFWSGWRERMESSTEKTLRWNTIVIGDFLNLGGVSHECRQYQFLRSYNVTKGRRVSFNEKVISGFAVIHVVYRDSRSLT